jgi:hypothetical protein
MDRVRSFGPLLALALVYSLGAALISTAGPPAALAGLARSEPVHIAAHAVLYGGLALVARRLLGSTPLALAVTAGAGLLQEMTQVIAVGRGPGRPELFDLAVDLAAAALVLALGDLLPGAGRGADLGPAKASIAAAASRSRPVRVAGRVSSQD